MDLAVEDKEAEELDEGRVGLPAARRGHVERNRGVEPRLLQHVGLAHGGGGGKRRRD